MRVRRWSRVLAMAGVFAVGSSETAWAQNVDELKRRIQDLERSTREQVESLKRMIEQQETERAAERRAQEERERSYEVLKEMVERQQLSLEKQEQRVANFFDLQAGRKQSNESRDPLGKDIQGNVYTSDQFKIRLGGSLRLHVQHNDTPVGESVSSALLPNAAAPGGGNNGGRENFRAFASRSRLNLAIQGPATLGGRTSGFFEMDFNQNAVGPGETNAVNPNPRLRHAFGRWAFPDVLTKGNELIFTLGQTWSFADNFPDSIDFNTLLAGLGAAARRNPRVEILDKYPITSNLKFLTSLGFERPLFDNQSLGGTDLGAGALSGFPAVSGGIGLEAGRLGRGFGIGSTQIYVRTTWGEFEEQFNRGTLIPNFQAQTGFTRRDFTNQVAHTTFILDRIGFNKTGRALTLKLQGGAVWTRGEGRITDSAFDRRLILDTDGRPTEAESVGAWINPMFWITDTLSLRWAGGFQTALDDDRPALTGTLIADPGGTGRQFFRVNNRQSEVSLWWTPGPFTFAIGYNFTKTNFRNVGLTGNNLVPATGSENRRNENNKVEFISWWSF